MTKILIIEDNKDNLQLMVYLLSKNGYETITAMDGQQGIRCAENEIPDLIICDIQMPVLDGFQVLKSLKKNELLKKIPIIAVTAYAMLGDREKILGAGFNAYIPKPIDPDLFVKEIEQKLPEELRSELKIENVSTYDVSEKKNIPSKGLALIVDNNFENRELSKNLLESAGFTVKTALNIQKGFEILQSEKPVLILSDFHMPDMTGLDFLKLLRKNREFHTIPFVIISATEPTQQQIQDIKQFGADGFITRPIDPADFLQIINKIYFQKRKVLLIEDNKDNLYLMIYLLSEHGFLPLVATNGEEGIKLVQNEKPSLIICDILLPNHNGCSVASEIKKLELDIPMIAVTGLGMKDDIDKIFDSGFDAYLEKPIDPANFIREVKSLLAIETEGKKTTTSPMKEKVFVIGKINEMVKNPLITSGFDVISFKNVAMAQMEMKTTLPDVIVLDDKDVSFAQVIRSSNTWKYLPIIVISETRMLSENPLDQCVPSTIESGAFLRVVENLLRFSKVQLRMNELENIIMQLKETTSLETLMRALHNFVGSSAIFGQNDLIQMARELEQEIKTIIENKEPITKQTLSQIKEHFQEMKSVYILSNTAIS